jgi:Uma2 family endonuclease
MTDRLPRHRITVDEYYRMAEDGRLDPDTRVELIEGEIIEMAPMGSAHAGKTSRIDHLLSRALGTAAQIRVQMPLRLDNHSEPEPDIAVVVSREDFYEERHPTPADVLLVVEISDSSSGPDRNRKISLYARGGVPEVWVVDVKSKRLHVYREPRDGAYTDVWSTVKPGMIALSALPGIRVDLKELFNS